MSALQTHSRFYYGIRIETESRFIDFNEGAAELSFELVVKDYTLTELAQAIEDGLNSEGALTYTVSMNRTTRIMTIAATGTFALLANSGTNVDFGAWAIAGFNATDRTGAATYNSQNAVGSSFAPQFVLQEYVPKEQNRRSLNAVVSKSASGAKVTVQTFGEERFIKFNIQYITNIPQPSGQRIKNNTTGVADAVAFLTSITDKGRFEFMPDEDDLSTFTTVLLESIGSDRDGTSFELREYYDKGLPFYFETGSIVLKALD